jgi:hypothetical protein
MLFTNNAPSPWMGEGLPCGVVEQRYALWGDKDILHRVKVRVADGHILSSRIIYVL